ncbi:MAG: hypothetical protein GIKADHBN_03536 [Phycisphaerales bacterium]|nr:hypothetical protein [Phycisphaerales bacterium]
MTGPGGDILHRRARGGRLAAALFLGGAFAAAWAGCSVEKNYKLLSFFFDGVPDPDQVRAVQEAAARGEGDLTQSPTYTVHQPYKEEKCADCHRGRLRISRNNSSICMECHPGSTEGHAVMHGPVAAGACMWCHAPHESAFPALMRSKPRDVCMQCHTEEMLVDPRVPEHSDPAQDCLTCHYGHGSEERFMLKPQSARLPAGGPAPVEPPAGQPPDRPPGAEGPSPEDSRGPIE